MSRSNIAALGVLNSYIKAADLPYEPVPLQRADMEDAIIAERFGFFYEVGGGKTLCSTMVAQAWGEDHTIVCAPPILLDQWERWLHKINQKDTSIFRGPKRTPEMLNHRWVMMSHAIFRDSADTILRFYTGKELSLIVDEAQFIKNPRSKLFKTAYKLIQPDRRALLLTGTPTSKPEDTYAYMRVKTPKIYRSFGHWENMHVGERNIFGAIESYRDLDMLAENFAINSVKRTKKELFGYDLKPIYDPIPYRLSPAHQKLYVKLAEEQLLLLPNNEKIDATTAQKLRHALQQIVVNFGKFTGNPDDRSAALDLLDSVIEQVDPMDKSKSKLVIWTYYQSSSKLITAYLKEKFGDRAVAAAYGGVNSQKGVDSIMFDDECRFGVFQAMSVGAGLELQHVCSENLFIEMSTVPMHMIQACGRTSRPGQKTRPTMRFGQAIGTIQIQLFQDLLNNDDLVTRVERTASSLRQEIFGG